MRKSILLLLILPLFIGKGLAKETKRDSVVFVSVNDIHAAIEQFPRFAYMVDSLRSIYPSLMVVGGGDYNSGNPINDYYKPAGYPTIALMNSIGFDVSTLGNHEFDVTQKGLGILTQVAAFPFIDANVFPDKKFGIELQPYIIKQLPSGLKVAFLGMLQIEADGLPSTHHDKLTDVRFALAHNLVPKYEFLRDSADLVVLVTHLGLKDDRIVAKQNQWLDLIIGGHSHTFVDGADWVGNVAITQSGSRLKYFALTTIVFENGKKVSTTIKSFPINIKDGKESLKVKRQLEWFSRDPYYQRVIAQASTPFQNPVQLGYLMCDAYRFETGSDISFQNTGGVRISNLPKGGVKVLDIFKLDPFGNKMMTVMLSAKEIENFIIAAYYKDELRPIYNSGLQVKYFIDKDKKLKRVEIKDEKGQPLKKGHLYKVAYSNYIHSAYPYEHKDTPLFFKNKTTAEVTVDYLKRMKTLEDYNLKPVRLELVTK